MSDEDDKIKRFRVVEGGGAPDEAESKVVRALEQAIHEAKASGWTEVVITMARPLTGYVALFGIEDGDADGVGAGSMYNLIGAHTMTGKFLVDAACGEAEG